MSDLLGELWIGTLVVLVVLITCALLAGCGDFNDGEVTAALMQLGDQIEGTQDVEWNTSRVRVQVFYVEPAAPRPTGAKYAQRVAEIEDLMYGAQAFFAKAMTDHGYGRMTFEMRLAPDGGLVERLTLPNALRWYQGAAGGPRLGQDLGAALDPARLENMINVYFIDFPPHSHDLGCAYGGGNSIGGQAALIQGCWTPHITQHELGHAFGLWHDWRVETDIMNYGVGPHTLSAGAAGWLARHSAFNSVTPIGWSFLTRDTPPTNIAADYEDLIFRVNIAASEHTVEDKDPRRQYDYAALMAVGADGPEVVAFTDNIQMSPPITYMLDFEGVLPVTWSALQIHFTGSGRYRTSTVLFGPR